MMKGKRTCRILLAAVAIVSLGIGSASAQQQCNDPTINNTIGSLNFWGRVSCFFGGSLCQVYQSNIAFLESCCLQGGDTSLCLCDSPDVNSPWTSSCQ